MNNLDNTDFKSLAKKQKSVQMKMRLLALSHFQEGHSRTQIAKFLKVSRTSVNRWVQVYLEEGLAGLEEKPRSGRPAFLTETQREQLAKFIESNAKNPDGGRLTGADIHAYIIKEFGKHYHSDSVYYLLKRMGFSWITSRSRHPKQSDEIQEDFKKTQKQNDPKDPGPYGPDEG